MAEGESDDMRILSLIGPGSWMSLSWGRLLLMIKLHSWEGASKGGPAWPKDSRWCWARRVYASVGFGNPYARICGNARDSEGGLVARRRTARVFHISSCFSVTFTLSQSLIKDHLEFEESLHQCL